MDFFYKVIVVDIDWFGYILMMDLICLWWLILYIDEEMLNGNKFWCFVDVDYCFLDVKNFFMVYFFEIFNINDLDYDEMYVDFIVIKVGDVNYMVMLNSFLGVDEWSIYEMVFLEIED